MTDFRDKFNGKLSFDFDTPNFKEQYGTGTVSEIREQKAQKTNGDDVANIINASANGVDSIGGIISMFMGKPSPNEQQTQVQAPPPKPPINPLVIGGVSLGVLLLIIFLISSSNGKNSNKK